MQFSLVANPDPKGNPPEKATKQCLLSLKIAKNSNRDSNHFFVNTRMLREPGDGYGPFGPLITQVRVHEGSGK